MVVLKKYEWVWKESEPISTYLTSIVIGKFKSETTHYLRNGNEEGIPLEYYWSSEIEQKKI